MPTATASRPTNRRRFTRRKVNPAKKVQEWELTKLRKQVKRMVPKPEWKIDDTTQALTTITTTATITNLLSPLQSTSDSARIGDEVTAKSVFVRLSIVPNATAGMNFLRIIIVRDRQNNAVAPTATQILKTSTNYLSPINEDFGKRFKVLFDRTYTVDNDANGSQVDKIYRKLNFKVEFPESGTVPNANGIYMLQISDQATDGPQTAWYARVRFTDM